MYLNNMHFRWNPVPLAVLLLSLALPAIAGAEQVLTPYSAEYKVKISGLSGRLTAHLRSTGEGFEATHAIKPTGLARIFTNGRITETSQFVAADGQVKASWYRSDDSLSKGKPKAEVTFDWSNNEMSGTVNDEEIQFLLEGLVHDRVAIQYQLMQDLLNGAPEESYILFDIDEFKTLIISSRVTTLWCVPELGYIPALIERHRKGELQLKASLKTYTPITE
jgi:hypothetical protein